MIRNTLQKIEDTLRSTPQASAKTKEELLELVRELGAELQALERTNREHAHIIAGHADQAISEATGAPAAAAAARPAWTGFASSARELEASHPKLASLVRSIADSLANVGI
jgi:hypothetical protein